MSVSQPLFDTAGIDMQSLLRNKRFYMYMALSISFICLSYSGVCLRGKYVEQQFELANRLCVLTKELSQEQEIARVDVTPFIHIVQDFPLYDHPSWRSRKGGHWYFQDWNIKERMCEILYVLQKTLNHPLVKTVNILTDLPGTKSYLTQHSLQNFHKVAFHDIPDKLTYKLAFGFMDQKLKGRVVMFKNVDIYPEQGFDRIDPKRLEVDRVMYCLSRYGRKELTCDMSDTWGHCDGPYLGAHDAYIWVPKGDTPKTLLDELDHPMNTYGLENETIMLFQKFGYLVLNPCKRLRMYHLHCSDVRSSNRKTISRRGSSNFGQANFTWEM